MADPSSSPGHANPEAVKRQLQNQERRVMGLRTQLYSLTDPSAGETLRQRLADEESTLRRLEAEARGLVSPPSSEALPPPRLLAAACSGPGPPASASTRRCS